MSLRNQVRGFASLSVGYALGKAVGFAAVIGLSRNLTSQVLGEYATIITFVGYLQAITNWGSDALGIRTVAQFPGVVRSQVEAITRSRFLVGSVPVAIFAVGLLHYGVGLSGAVAIVAIWTAYLFRCDWAILARGRNALVGTWIVAREATFTALAFSIVRASGSLDVALWCYAGAEWVWSMGTRISVGGRGTASATTGRIRPSQILAQGLPLVVVSVTVLTSNKVDVPILARFRSASEVASYWSAYNIMFAAMFLGGMWSRVALPSMSKQLRDGAGRTGGSDAGLHYVVVGGAIGSVMSIGLAGLAESALHLAYGGRYDSAGTALAILAIALPANYMSSTLASRLVAESRQSEWTRAAVISAGANLLLNLMLIPRNGIEGAAIATAISEWIGLGVLALSFRREASFRALSFSLAYVSLGAVAGRLSIERLGPDWRLAGTLLTLTAFALFVAPVLLQRLPRTLRLRSPVGAS